MRKMLRVIIPALLVALLAGCGQPVVRHTDTPTPVIPTPQATATIQPTVVGTPSIVDAGHPCSSDTSGQVSYVRIGDLKVSAAAFSLAYPANALASNLDASRPYPLSDTLPNPPNPPVNPLTQGGNGYGFTICNTSSAQRHVIRAITVKIAAFKAYNGTLNSYMFCDMFYQRPDGVTGGGCGGGRTLDEALQADFAAGATTGAQVTAAQVNTGNASGDPNGFPTPPLPVALGPGQMLVFALGVTPPTAPGMYTFAFGVSYDAVTAATFSTMPPTIFDSAAVKWNGNNCNTPAMLNQIPANSTAKYICAPHT